MFLENCSYTKSVLLFLSTGATEYFFTSSIPRTVLNAIRFIPSSLIANLEIILSNFQQKFALVRSFQHFAIQFSKIGEGKRDVFYSSLYFAINPSNLASKNDVTELLEL